MDILKIIFQTIKGYSPMEAILFVLIIMSLVQAFIIYKLIIKGKHKEKEQNDIDINKLEDISKKLDLLHDKVHEGHSAYNSTSTQILKKLEKLSMDVESLITRVKENEDVGKINDVRNDIMKIRDDIVELKSLITIWLTKGGN